MNVGPALGDFFFWSEHENGTFLLINFVQHQTFEQFSQTELFLKTVWDTEHVFFVDRLLADAACFQIFSELLTHLFCSGKELDEFSV